jgi:hypothetical protein
MPIARLLKQPDREIAAKRKGDREIEDSPTPDAS